MQKKLIHIIGGGISQISLIEKAKLMGYRTLVTDMYKNPPGKEHADLFEQINTTHIEETLTVARCYNIDAVVTDGSDVAVPTAAYIAKAMSLPGIAYETSLNFTNKHRMRDVLHGRFTHMPKYRFCDNVKACMEYIDTVTYPIIVKPVNSQGSKGVYMLSGPDISKIVDAFEESGGSGILVEEYIDGQQFSVETAVVDSKVYHLAVTEIEFFPFANIARKLKYFDEVEAAYVEKLFSINEEVVRLLDLKNGPTHGEYRINQNGDIF